MRAAALLCALLCAAPAAADRSFDLALLQPSVDAYGLVAIERAETPQRWEVGAQLLLGYAHRPLHLRLATPDRMGTTEADLVRGQLTADLGLSLGLWDFLELALLLPVAAQWYDEEAVGQPVVAQPPSMAAPNPPTTTTGLYRGAPRENLGLAGAGPRDPRLSLKARLWRNQHFGVGLLLSATAPLGNSASFLGDRFATLRPALLMDVRLLGRLSLLGNIGATVRAASQLRDPVSDVVLLEAGHELTFALGAAYRFHRLAAASLELFGGAPLAGASPSGPQPGETSPPAALTANVDLLAAAYLYPTAGLRLVAGVGGGVVAGSPRRDPVRVLLGVAWTPSPRRGGLP